VKNSGVNVFDGIRIGPDESSHFQEYLNGHDFAVGTRRLIVHDVRQFASWFSESNQEPFVISRVTTRDVIDFRDYLRRAKGQAVATVNRSLVLLRGLFEWLAEQNHIAANPAKQVKELKRQQLAPKGLDKSQVRKLLREIELRQDTRANAIFSLFLYTGCRVGDLVTVELSDVLIADRSGSVVFRHGKGNKQRSVPLPLPARRGLQAWMEFRPPVESSHVFVGERGPLTDRGIRSLCDKYSAICGFKIHPHLLRHTMAHRFLEDNPGDLVSLAQILGHDSLETTKRYVQRAEEQLAEASERMTY